MNQVQPGQVWFFKFRHQIARYGDYVIVNSIQTAVSRPFGYSTVLVDMTSVNGTAIQWPASQVKREMFKG